MAESSHETTEINFYDEFPEILDQDSSDYDCSDDDAFVSEEEYATPDR